MPRHSEDTSCAWWGFTHLVRTELDACEPFPPQVRIGWGSPSGPLGRCSQAALQAYLRGGRAVPPLGVTVGQCFGFQSPRVPGDDPRSPPRPCPELWARRSNITTALPYRVLTHPGGATPVRRASQALRLRPVLPTRSGDCSCGPACPSRRWAYLWIKHTPACLGGDPDVTSGQKVGRSPDPAHRRVPPGPWRRSPDGAPPHHTRSGRIRDRRPGYPSAGDAERMNS
jgi:hypothetical protein